jgi:hypothetical protein
MSDEFEDALAKLRGERIPTKAPEISSPPERKVGTRIVREPEPMDAAVGPHQKCSPCGGKGGFANGLQCRTCNGKGQHRLTLPAKWIYITRKGEH